MYPRFSIAPINWTNDDDPTLGGDIPLDVCLSEMKDAGYEGCELGNKFPKHPLELADCLRRYNLILTTDWIGTNFTVTDAYDDTLKHFQERVSFLSHFGVEALKVCEVGHAIQQTAAPIFHKSVTFDEAQWKLLIQGLQQAARIARDHGMYIAYHHHLGTGVEKHDAIVRLMNETAPEDVSLLPDTGHLYAAGINPVDIFTQFSTRIKYVHLKDVRKDVMDRARSLKMSFMDAVRAGVFTVPSDGCIDFASIFAVLKDMRYQGWLVVEAEQDPKLAPPLLLAQKAREFLRAQFSC